MKIYRKYMFEDRTIIFKNIYKAVLLTLKVTDLEYHF